MKIVTSIIVLTSLVIVRLDLSNYKTEPNCEQTSQGITEQKGGMARVKMDWENEWEEGGK
jgi:ribosomal protein S6